MAAEWTSVPGVSPADRGQLRGSSLAGVVAGVVYALLGALSVATPISGATLDGVLVVGNLLEILVLFGLYRLYRDIYPLLGAGSFVVFVLTTAANVVGTVGYAVGVGSLAVLAFPVGLVGQLFGYLGYAWMTARENRLPWWTGGLLVLSVLTASVGRRVTGTTAEFGDYPGALALGVVYLVVGGVMYRYVTR